MEAEVGDDLPVVDAAPDRDETSLHPGIIVDTPEAKKIIRAVGDLRRQVVTAVTGAIVAAAGVGSGRAGAQLGIAGAGVRTRCGAGAAGAARAAFAACAPPGQDFALVGVVLEQLVVRAASTAAVIGCAGVAATIGRRRVAGIVALPTVVRRARVRVRNDWAAGREEHRNEK